LDDQLRFARALARRFADYDTLIATNTAEAIAVAERRHVDAAIVDFYIHTPTRCELGTNAIAALRVVNPCLVAVMLTGAELSFETHRELQRLDAPPYEKCDDSVAKIRAYFDGIPEIPSNFKVPTLHEAKARHARTLIAAFGSMSEAARRTKQDRRTLQRILNKGSKKN
jgi:ActR/RegA family two-component response regulator